MQTKSEARSQWLAIAVISLLSAGTMYAATMYIVHNQRTTNIQQSIDFIGQEKIFGTIFKFYPESKEELRLELDRIYRSRQDVRNRAENAGRLLIRQYLEKSVPLASEQSLVALVSWNAKLIGRLHNDPAACVDFFLGRRTTDIRIANGNDSAPLLEGDLKAAVIASSKEAPSPAIPFANRDEANRVLAELYAKAGQDSTNLEKLERFGELPPEEGCRVARSFMSALAEGPPGETARLYKHFMPIVQLAR